MDHVDVETIMKLIKGRTIADAEFSGDVLELDLGNDLRLRVMPEPSLDELFLWMQLQ